MIQEGVIKELHPHAIGFLGFYFSGIALVIIGIVSAILGVFPFGITIFIGLFTGISAVALGEVSRRAETFYILEGGVAWQYKMLSTSRKFVEYEKIQNLEVRQSFSENMLGIGSIHFDTAGADKTEINFRGIKDPYGIEKIVRAKMAIL